MSCSLPAKIGRASCRERAGSAGRTAQPDDGIRDGHVTGVQTCALPIFVEKMVEIYERNDDLSETVNIQKDGLTVILVVGVNGVGKTTSIGKLAYKYKQEGKNVMLAAGEDRKSVV